MNCSITTVNYYFTFLLTCPPDQNTPADVPIIPESVFGCYLMCLTKCILSKDAESCQDTDCAQFTSSKSKCSIEDNACWRTLCNTAITTENSDNPIGLAAYFSNQPEYTPRRISVTWNKTDGAQLYILDIVDRNEKPSSSKRKLITNVTTAEFDNDNLCAEYSLKITTATLSNFREYQTTVQLSKPVPVLLNSNLVLRPNLYGTLSDFNDWSEKITKVVEFREPSGWDYFEGDYNFTFDDPKLIQCKYSVNMSELASNVIQLRKKDSPVTVFVFPDSVAESRCNFTISLVQLVSKCGPVFKLSSEATSTIDFTCTNVQNLECKDDKEPICHSKLTYFEDHNYKSEGKYVAMALKWNVPEKMSKADANFGLCDAFNISEVERPTKFQFNPSQPKILNSVLRQSCAILNETNVRQKDDHDVIIEDVFEPGKLYIVRLCTIFDKASFKDWYLRNFTNGELNVVDLSELAASNTISSISQANVTVTSSVPTPGGTSVGSIVGLVFGFFLAIFITMVATALFMKSKYANNFDFCFFRLFGSKRFNDDTTSTTAF